MKLSAKPLSSPGRTEKFPPPLMRFLRTNVGSKSRGRSRSSPMFVRKRNNINNNSAIETTQEPSSPKVTCMGQVRVKRSSKKGPKKKPPKPPSSCRCQCIPGKYLFFCRHLPGKILSRPKLRRAVWGKWASFFRLRFRRKVGIRGEDSSKNVGSRFEEKSEDSEESEQEQELEEEDEKEAKNKSFLSSISPPKNALILTRCRSAPYRSSSLACRFWGSPLKSEEEEEQKKKIENKKDDDEEEEEEKEKPKMEMGRLSCEESKMEDSEETEEKSRLSDKEFEGSETGKRSSESSKTEEEEEEGKFVERPLVLTRCKSEPARTGEKLDPELGFWTDRNLDLWWQTGKALLKLHQSSQNRAKVSFS